MTIAFIRFA